MSRYRILNDDPALDAKKGDEIDLDLTADQELELLHAARVEILPRVYRVLAGRVHETDAGNTFEAALPLGEEELLLGSHIERVAKPAKPTPKKEDK